MISLISETMEGLRMRIGAVIPLTRSCTPSSRWRRPERQPRGAAPHSKFRWRHGHRHPLLYLEDPAIRTDEPFHFLPVASEVVQVDFYQLLYFCSSRDGISRRILTKDIFKF